MFKGELEKMYSGKEVNYGFWLDEWLKSKKMSVKDSTYIRYKNIVNRHIKPELGQFLISSIHTPVIEKYVADKLKCGRMDHSGGISPKTMTDILVIIKDSFQYAQMCEIAVSCNFDRILIKKTPREMRVLSFSEEQKLLRILKKDPDRYKLGIFLCLYTGIRIGELCALRWKHISIDDQTLKVEQTMQRLQCEDETSTRKTQIIFTEPKSHSSLRLIPLPDFLMEVIKPFTGHPDTFILSGQSARYVEPRTMQNKFKAYLSQADIIHANFHSLRHTFATRCIEAGFDVKTLSEILGHSSVKLTLDKYVHASLDLKRKNMSKLQLPL